MNKETSFVSFVIYTYNEENKIRDFLDRIYALEYFENFEIVCVDDGSTDNTIDLIKAYITEGKALTIVDMGFHQGLELAMNAGVDISIGDFVYEFDSIDMTYDADVIYKIYQECLNGNDIVLACPNKNRNLGSSLFYKLYNKVSRTHYKLQTDTFRILSRRAVNRVHSMSSVLPYRKAVYANCGLVMKNHC